MSFPQNDRKGEFEQKYWSGVINIKEKIISFILIAISLILAVVGFAILPDQVAIQIGTDGTPTNVVPKLIAILIPVAITVFGAIRFNSDKSDRKRIYFLVAILGYVASAFIFIINK